MRAAEFAADQAVLEATTRAVCFVRDRGVLYGDLFSPLHTDGLRGLARRLTVHVKLAAIGDCDIEAVTPPVRGRYLMVLSTDVDERRRAFAFRHGLGHVAAGHVTELSFLHSRSDRDDYMTHEERVADLFAVVDLVPAHEVEMRRDGRASWGAIRQWLCRELRQHTQDWPEERVLDRAQLRVALYRERGL